MFQFQFFAGRSEWYKIVILLAVIQVIKKHQRRTIWHKFQKGIQFYITNTLNTFYFVPKLIVDL